MNFLTLCQRVRQECGVSGAGPSSTVSQTGMLGKIVQWVNSAYQDIQRHRDDWLFRQDSSSFTTTSGLNNYLSQMAEVSKPNVVTCYLDGVDDELVLERVEYDTFYKHFLIGTQKDARPYYYTMAPDGGMLLGPKPDDAYTITFTYTKVIDTLSGNSDTPIIPDDYQESIIWKACIYYAQHEEADILFQAATTNYRTVLNRMKIEEQPVMIFGAQPLA